MSLIGEVQLYDNGKGHGYYTINEGKIMYDLFYPMGTALSWENEYKVKGNKVGPLCCEGCLEWGVLRGVYVGPCVDCLYNKVNIKCEIQIPCDCCDDLAYALEKRSMCLAPFCEVRRYLRLVDPQKIGCGEGVNVRYNYKGENMISTHLQFSENYGREDLEQKNLNEEFDNEEFDNETVSTSATTITILSPKELQIPAPLTLKLPEELKTPECSPRDAHTPPPIISKRQMINRLNKGPYLGKIEYSENREWRVIYDISNGTARTEKCEDLNIKFQKERTMTIDVKIEYSSNGKTQYVYDNITEELITRHSVE